MLDTKETLKNIKPYLVDDYLPECEMKLDSNENVYGPSPKVIEAFRHIEEVKLNLYPCYGKLLDALCNRYVINKDRLILTNGCDEAINIILQTFLNADENVVAFSPTFSMPYIYSKLIGADFKQVKYPEKWEFSLEVLDGAIDNKTKIIYLCTPNNPTGSVIEPKTVQEVAKKYPDKIILLDLTYVNYSDIPEKDYFDLLRGLNNLVCTKSFSKDFALAGLRLGFIAAPAGIISEFKKVISPYSVNSLAVFAGLKSLEDLSWLNYVTAEVKKTREYLLTEFKKLGFEPFKSQGNFILVDFGQKVDFIYGKLKAKGILVRKFSAENLKGCLRISIPKQAEAEKIIKILSKARKLLVFDLDGVVFDVSNSYRFAIEKTFEHFAGKTVDKKEVQRAKNLGGLSNDWDLTQYLLQKHGVDVAYDKIVEVFTDIFYNPEKPSKNRAIDNEKIVLDSKFFEKLSEKFDLAVFTGRPRNEAFYSLKKFNIDRYFSYFVCLEDVEEGKSKPHPDGLLKIKESCIFEDICFFGDTVDDIEAGKAANVRTFGIIPPNAAEIEATTKSLFACGAAGVIDGAYKILDYELFLEEEKCK